MHGRGGEERRRQRHMWTEHASSSAATTAAAVPPCPVPSPVSETVDSDHGSPDFLLKEGRKFSIGDCALFQAGNSPPFIGIIRWFTPGQETYTKLGVNWLYRPADIKLTKGVSLEAAPNEVFYSFHKDEISAESLLHPCKVAFLRKGVELPSGLSSFVCWRVYDVTNKRLWWLTDSDYIDERQEEVDQLLDKTRLDMHAAVQSGGRSPKPLSSHLPLKSSSDSVQNSGTSLHSQAKGKKRGERGDQGSDSMKRERLSKADEGDSGIFRLDSMIKSEIAKITDKSGLTNNDAVEKLVQLMQLDRGEKKIDLAGRALLADVITATERNDCLVKFVQLKGVPMLDDWLQEAHKGKNGDGSSSVEGDKSVEDLLLALLRALDKLPVNLSALQTCNIGKSVNNLRSHKNMEIQRKARSLVDTWKKRVDAEMKKIEMAKLNDAKSIGSSQAVSWPGKPGFSEASVGGSKRAAATEVAGKSATNQPCAFKSLPLKNGHGDSTVRSNTAMSGSLKLSSTLSTPVVTGTKDSQTRTGTTSGTAEPQLPTIKDEKNSISSQSQNNSQSCSNDHAKTAGTSWKEDVRNSTASSPNISKTSGGASRHRRPSNGFVATGASGFQKENGFSKSNSLIRSTTPEKVLQSGQMVDRTADVPVADHGNSHRLIVRLPNPGRSPVRSVGGGSTEDLSLTGSRASSPGASEKSEHVDHKTKLKSDVCQANGAADVNIESCQSGDVKGVVGSSYANRSPIAFLDEEHSKSTDDTGKAADSLKASILLEPKFGKQLEVSSSSVNVLIGSCSKYDKNDLAGDCMQYEEGNDADRMFTMRDADKMSNSDLASHVDSPQRKPHSSDDTMTQTPEESQDNNAKTKPGKNESSAALLQVQDDIKQNGPDFRNSKYAMLSEETKATGEHRDRCHVSPSVSCKSSAPSMTSDSNFDTVAADGRVPLLNLPVDSKDGVSGDNSTNHPQEKWKASALVSNGLPACEQKVASPIPAENKSGDHVHEKVPECNISLADGSEIDHISTGGTKCEKELVGEPSCPPLDKQRVVDEGIRTSTEHIPLVMAVCSEDVTRNVGCTTAVFASDLPCLEADEPKEEKSDDMEMKRQQEPRCDKKDHKSLARPAIDTVCSSMNPINNGIEEDSEKEVIKHQSVESTKHEEPPLEPTCETVQSTKALDSKLCGNEVGEAAEVACSPETSSAVIICQPDPSGKLGFDLNEGFSVDEGNVAEAVTSSVPGCLSAVYLPNMTPFTVSPMSSSLPFHITVASPAKGPFVPPETLLKSKGEGGWKGSAATSAFRPAEPRKVLEMPLGTSDTPSFDTASSKQFHPPLNIDLNVPDETTEDIAHQNSAQQTETKSGVLGSHDAPIRSSGGLDLDLNRVDESTETGQLSASTSRRLEVPLLSVRPASRGSPDGEGIMLRDFDLNGPGIDEIGAEQLSRGRHTKGSSMPFLPSLRVNANDTGILSSWFPPGNHYSAIAIPSFLPDRGDQPYPVVAAPGAQMILGSSTGGGPFGSDHFRGPVLSSSHTMTFSPAAAFSYAGFPFGSSFPLASTSFSGGSTTYIDPVSGGACFPAMPTLVGRAGAASPYMRPNAVSLPEGSTTGGSESSRKWGWQNLDLNAGPGSIDIDGREDRSSFTSRQLAVASSQALSGEHARMYHTAGGGLKRKEPEGGWDTDRVPYKQHPWQ